jgi:hypothetical protein
LLIAECVLLVTFSYQLSAEKRGREYVEKIRENLQHSITEPGVATSGAIRRKKQLTPFDLISFNELSADR